MIFRLNIKITLKQKPSKAVVLQIAEGSPNHLIVILLLLLLLRWKKFSKRNIHSYRQMA